LSNFDDVIVSAEVGMVKPDLEIFRLAAKRLGVEPSGCIFIDDIKSFIEASERVGMTGKVYEGLEDLKISMPKLLGV
jgi:HAD superfamily hydrolase (TIGR01509 family)